MQYEVYHAKNPSFSLSEETILEEVKDFIEGYNQVATVECANLEHVFQVTNHIDQDWKNNPEVIEVKVPTPRSTSVGDCVMYNQGGELKVAVCMPTGWADVTEIIFGRESIGNV